MTEPIRGAWYRDSAARRFIARGYIPWLGGLSLAWEIAHLPLYTLWREAGWSYMAFAVAHCTVGDMLIGMACLALALLAARQGPIVQWKWPRIALGTGALGVSYTAFSEWLNVYQLQSWSYSARMPVVQIFGVELGLSPLLQWLVVPSLALYLARCKTRPHPLHS